MREEVALLCAYVGPKRTSDGLRVSNGFSAVMALLGI